MTGMRRSRASRALRGLIGASIATFVALLSHVAAGGAMPGWVGIALPWLLSVMVCTLLAGRALSLIRLSLAVAASQALFHCLAGELAQEMPAEKKPTMRGKKPKAVKA